AENGLKVVHVWWWNDVSGFMGKGVYEPINEAGLRRFIDECHRRGLKAIPYVSPGYLDIRSPAYRPEWSRKAARLKEVFYDLDMLCPGSPGWRTYFYNALDNLMDNYGFDGIYWDGGLGLKLPGCNNTEHDGHIHFKEMRTELRETVDHSDDYVEGIDRYYAELWNDFLAGIYARIKSRNGIVVAHIGADIASPFKDKCWDYMLLGEGVSDLSVSGEKAKDYEPYVVRFVDWSQLITNWRERDLTPDPSLIPALEHLSMAFAVPYMQFPWLEDGCYGEHEDLFTISGAEWKQEWDHWLEWAKAQKKAGLDPVMCASMAAGRERYLEYLRTYREMTPANTVAFIEVKDGGRQRSYGFPMTEGDRRVSVFINDSIWVAVGNIGKSDQTVNIASLDGSKHQDAVALKAGTLTVLRYFDMSALPEITKFVDGSNGRSNHGSSNGRSSLLSDFALEESCQVRN
ncbi:MAG: DUF6259 domain-containing protein, partial [bacterium]|nr:DUF6259 domain-containing protein [bacterium]